MTNAKKLISKLVTDIIKKSKKNNKNVIVYLINTTEDIISILKNLNINYKIIKEGNKNYENNNLDNLLCINIYRDLFDIIDKPNKNIYIISDCEGDKELNNFLINICDEMSIDYYITDSVYKTTITSYL
jgi:hypothetical protein